MAIVKSQKQEPKKGKVIDLREEFRRRRIENTNHEILETGTTKKEIDLEKGAIAYTDGIRPNDTLVLKAGRGTFKIVFRRVNEKDELEMQFFNNKRREEGRLKMGETQKIWGGMLMDGRLFEVRVERVPVNCRNGVVAKIDLDFWVSEESIMSC